MLFLGGLVTLNTNLIFVTFCYYCFYSIILVAGILMVVVCTSIASVFVYRFLTKTCMPRFTNYMVVLSLAILNCMFALFSRS